MSLFRRQARAQAQPNADRDLLDDLLLVRIVCAGGATRPQLVRDLGPLFANKLSPAEWRVRTETALARLANGTHLRENRGRYRISEEGAQVVASFLGEKEARARAWSEQRDLWLVAKALSVDATKPSLRKALTRPEGLSALIVQQAFGLSLREALSPSKLRTALALVAQERRPRTARRRGKPARSQPRTAASSPLNCCRAREIFPPTPASLRRSAPSKWAPRAPRSRCCGSGFCAGSPRRTRGPAAKSRRRHGRSTFRQRASSALVWRNFPPVCSPRHAPTPRAGQATARRLSPTSGTRFARRTRVGSLRDRVQVHAGRGASRRPARAGQRRPEGQTATSRTSRIPPSSTRTPSSTSSGSTA